MLMLLAGDVGGTKTKLGLFRLTEAPRTPQIEANFRSQDYPNLEAIAQEFLGHHQVSVKYASFGVAGPVVKGRAKTTNLPWVIEEKSLASALKLSNVHLLNDLEAIATSVPFLARSDLRTLNRGRPDPKGCIGVIAPGTGLGEAFITRKGHEYSVHPSEGGHTDFAPNNQFEIGLLEYFMRQLDHVSYEEVCSGIGIRHIHEYVEKTSPPETAAWHAKELEAEDLVRLLADAALNKKKNSGCNTCATTFETFGSILGAEAGNLALKILATGGIYIGGGIAPNILPLLRAGPFMDSFKKKGRLSRIVTRIPVHVILNLDVALLGAARSGIERVRLDRRSGTRKVGR